MITSYSKRILLASLCALYVQYANSQITGITCEPILLPEYDGCPPWENVPTYFPYPYDCRRFMECSNGYAIVQCCPPGTVWDQNLNVCNHEAFTPCVIVTTEAPSSPTTRPSTTTPTTNMPTTTTPTTTTPTTTTPTTTTPTTTTPTTTTPSITTPTTTTPTTTTPTTTTPTTTTPTITTPNTTTPTTTTPTTTTPTTTTPTTTTPTITTPTTTTPTTTTPTTTTPTTTTPTTTTPTTTTPTTTTPTTTTPTTTTPTITTPNTTTTIRTTTLSPFDGSYLIINVQANMALDVYNANLTNGNQIQTYPIRSDCSDNAEVWRLEFLSSYSAYIIRSALGGWRHAMHTNEIQPHIFENTYTHGLWFVVRVSGTNYWNIYSYRYNFTGRSSLHNTGIASGNGGSRLELAPLQPSDPAQMWELTQC